MAEFFRLGQRVMVTARTLALYPDQVQPGDQLKHAVPSLGRTDDRRKQLYRRALRPAWSGVIIGWRRRATGWYSEGGLHAHYDGYDEYGPYLHADKYHKLWLVATSLRWKDPIEALAEDIEPLAKEEGA